MRNSPLTVPRGRRRSYSACVLAAAALLTFTGCSPKSDDTSQSASVTPSNVKLTQAQLQHIRFYTVAPLQFHKTVETNGAVDFDNDQATSVLAPFSGPVSRLLVSLGQHVKKGEPLAIVDSPDFASAVSDYRKAVAAAATARRLANLDKDLVQHQGVSAKEADQAQSDATSAEADREAARQALVSLNVPSGIIKAAQAGHAVAHAAGVIRAPITGTVVEKLITPGELLQAGSTPCFTVADLSRVWVNAQIFDSDLNTVSVGDHAEVTGVGANAMSGTVTNVSALVDPDTRSVVTRVVLDNPQGALKKQMYVRVRIQAKQDSSGLLVPVSAVLRDDENLPFVYVAQQDGSFARVHVTLGYRIGDRYDVTEGLRTGNRIVVDGGLFLQFMQSQ
ncbi:MAG TPA: efflux RND transporter periplasmic adaptor subunit [Rhizomicrobium sp.]|jgi:cobalt-zinc-cadmium efflux system membrane fusion protein